MAYTQSDIDQLKTAIASGALEVQYPNGRVRYRSLAEMRETLAIMEAEVSGSSTVTPRQTRTVYRK